MSGRFLRGRLSKGLNRSHTCAPVVTQSGRRVLVPNELSCEAKEPPCGFIGVPTRASLGSKRFQMLENVEL